MRAGDNRWRPLILASIAAALPIVVITTMLLLGYGGETTTDRVKDLGQALAALAAALSLAGTAWRAPSRTRLSWILLSASGASVFIGQVIEGIWQDEAFPNPAEIGLLIAIPFASAGLLVWPKVQNIYASRLHAVLDFLMVAFSLAFVALGFGLLQDYNSAGGRAAWLGPLFPAGDVLLLTVVFVKLRRSRPTRPGRLALLLIGFSINALSDSASTILTAAGAWPSIRTVVGAAEMYGFALVALAPLWPRGPERKVDSDTALWRLLLPYAGVVAVLFTAIGSELIAHRSLPSSVDVPAGGLVVVLIVSQVLAFVEGRTLLRQSREAEAKVKARETMLQNVIDHAPQGVARITRDRRIANANPRLASILYTPKRLVESASLESFLPHDDPPAGWKHRLLHGHVRGCHRAAREGRNQRGQPPADGKAQPTQERVRLDGQPRIPHRAGGNPGLQRAHSRPGPRVERRQGSRRRYQQRRSAA
jgi:PAS domain-containing protein